MALDRDPRPTGKKVKKPKEPSSKKRVLRTVSLAIKFYLQSSIGCDCDVDDLFSDMEVSEDGNNSGDEE